MTTTPGSTPTTPPVTPAQCADAAADLVRTINHTSRPKVAVDGGLVDVSDVYDTIAGLALMTARLPQALTQLAAHVITDAAAGRLVAVDEHGHHGDPTDAVQASTGRLDEAAHTARVLASMLEDAQQALAVLGHA